MEPVAVVGLGLLGRGIAACLLGHGRRVVGWAPTEAEHAVARAHIAEAIGELVDRAGFPTTLRDEWPARYTAVGDLAALAGCGFVIESVIEDFAAKQAVYDAVEAAVGPDVPIASNTSALPISRLQAARRRPERFVGMHWAQPAHATRFLELVRGDRTGDAALAAAEDLGRRVGKDPCVCKKDVPGYIVNRLGYAVYREALHLVESGVADPETIDKAFRNAVGLWASLDGPFRWIDISGGPALYAKVMQGLWPDLSSATELPPLMRRLMEEGAKGAIDGNGFYTYGEGDAAAWERKFRDHVWAARRPQDEKGSGA
jgi:3-hydroxybutyryl-CoA dehydrogenase